jgi:hypothetical protein
MTKEDTVQIIDYMIVSAETSHDVEVWVKRYMEQGWQPLGGVSVAAYERTMGGGRFEEVHRFCQAMVKYGA